MGGVGQNRQSRSATGGGSDLPAGGAAGDILAKSPAGEEWVRGTFDQDNLILTGAGDTYKIPLNWDRLAPLLNGLTGGGSPQTDGTFKITLQATNYAGTPLAPIEVFVPAGAEQPIISQLLEQVTLTETASGNNERTISLTSTTEAGDKADRGSFTFADNPAISHLLTGVTLETALNGAIRRIFGEQTLEGGTKVAIPDIEIYAPDFNLKGLSFSGTPTSAGTKLTLGGTRANDTLLDTISVTVGAGGTAVTANDFAHEDRFANLVADSDDTVEVTVAAVAEDGGNTIITLSDFFDASIVHPAQPLAWFAAGETPAAALEEGQAAAIVSDTSLHGEQIFAGTITPPYRIVSDDTRIHFIAGFIAAGVGTGNFAELGEITKTTGSGSIDLADIHKLFLEFRDGGTISRDTLLVFEYENTGTPPDTIWILLSDKLYALTRTTTAANTHTYQRDLGIEIPAAFQLTSTPSPHNFVLYDRPTTHEIALKGTGLTNLNVGDNLALISNVLLGAEGKYVPQGNAALMTRGKVAEEFVGKSLSSPAVYANLNKGFSLQHKFTGGGTVRVSGTSTLDVDFNLPVTIGEVPYSSLRMSGDGVTNKIGYFVYTHAYDKGRNNEYWRLKVYWGLLAEIERYVSPSGAHAVAGGDISVADLRRFFSDVQPLQRLIETWRPNSGAQGVAAKLSLQKKSDGTINLYGSDGENHGLLATTA